MSPRPLTWHRVLLVAAVPNVSFAQLAGGGGAPEIDVLRVVLVLLGCLALGVAVVFWIRRRLPAQFRPTSGRSVRVLETARLNVRAALYVVEFDGRHILLAADSNGIVRVAESDRARDVPPRPGDPL